MIGLKRLVELSQFFQVDINVLLGPEYRVSTEQSLNAELAATVADSREKPFLYALICAELFPCDIKFLNSAASRLTGKMPDSLLVDF